MYNFYSSKHVNTKQHNFKIDNNYYSITLQL